MRKIAPYGGLVIALALAGAAQAQSDAATSPSAPAAAPPAAAPAPAATAPAAVSADAFKPGMVVKDPDGATVGAVVRAGAASNGRMAVVVNIDGKEISLPANLFTPAGDTINSSVTKAQIQAAVAPKG